MGRQPKYLIFIQLRLHLLKGYHNHYIEKKNKKNLNNTE